MVLKIAHEPLESLLILTCDQSCDVAASERWTRQNSPMRETAWAPGDWEELVSAVVQGPLHLHMETKESWVNIDD